MLKVLTILGTRPEIIRLSRIIDEIDKTFNHILIHTGQNFDFELNKIFFSDLDIRDPDYFLDCASGKETSATVIGKIISSVDVILDKEKPNCVLVLGDTNSSLSVIAAKKRKIPIFHIEAGNRCFDQRVPEEVNRKIVDHISDINLTYSEIARQYLINEGFPPDQIIKIGSPLFEVLDFYSEKIEKSKILKKLNLEENKFFLISAHREENIDSSKNFKKLIYLIESLEKKYKIPIIISTHPRTRIKLKQNSIPWTDLVHFEKPLGFCDYVKLQKNAKIILSDSGTISEESSILGLKALNIRDVNERPEAMEEGSVMMVGLDEQLVIKGIEYLISTSKEKTNKPVIVKDYNAKNVSIKVVKLIISYTHYVNHKVWKKYDTEQN